MLFIVRGKTQSNQRTLRVHAQTAELAEAIGWKRGLFVTEVTPVDCASGGVGKLHKVADMVWQAWRHTPANGPKAFGSGVSTAQAAALLVLGLITWGLDLKALNLI
ncbi:MAG: hypothetical protein ABIP55_06170 [Tepidisphaeraceae bacterium]